MQKHHHNHRLLLTAVQTLVTVSTPTPKTVAICRRSRNNILSTTTTTASSACSTNDDNNEGKMTYLLIHAKETLKVLLLTICTWHTSHIYRKKKHVYKYQWSINWNPTIIKKKCKNNSLFSSFCWRTREVICMLKV